MAHVSKPCSLTYVQYSLSTQGPLKYPNYLSSAIAVSIGRAAFGLPDCISVLPLGQQNSSDQ